MLASRKRLSPSVVALALVLVVLFYHSSHVDHIYQTWSLSFDSYSLSSPANRTLGFGAVVVVSSKDSERRHTLVQAANVTEFDVVIPDQPKWTEGDLQRFIDGQEDAQRGSILAWLGHHNALRWFLNSGLETALILEDDVDWDIRLRSIQIPLAAGAARQILSPQRSRYSFSKVREDTSNYWGDHNAWDLLYLGHCGDYFEEVTEDGPNLQRSYNLTSMPHVVYRDPTVPSPSNLHPFTQTLFRALNMPPHARALHRSKFPLCSFGYAVNRQTAKQLLRDLAPPRLQPRGPRAFDVALLHACRKGDTLPSIPLPQTPLSHNTPSSGLRCWTLNSELFHHMPGRSLVDGIGQEMGEQPGIPPVDLAGAAQVVERNETSNIDCGFWNGAFAFNENDVEHLRFLQERVGRHGTCMKEGKYVPSAKIRT